MGTMAANSLFNRKKHTIRLKHGYMNEIFCHRAILVIDVRSSENVADPLTKGLKKELVERLSLEWVSNHCKSYAHLPFISSY